MAGAMGLFERILTQTRLLSRTIVLTLNNTFRNKGRVIITQITLVGSGLVFMMVMHTQASLVYTYSDVIFSLFDANVFLRTENDERITAIESLALKHPEVTAVETWSFSGATIWPAARAEQNDDRTVDIRGLPVPTLTYVPNIRTGRWLEPSDQYAIVLHQDVADDVGVGVGDWITLKLSQGREVDWLIVGTLVEPFNTSAVHVQRDLLLRELGQVGRASTLRIQTIGQDATSEATVATELKARYEANGYPIRPDDEETAHQITEDILGGGISIVINLLAGMAVVIAIVGGVSLSGVLSINVLDRQREIGVMRAIGASSFHIFRLFVGEGLILGWLSWLVAWPLSVPAGRLMANGLANVMGDELTYAYSIPGIFYWLGIITALSIIASVLPARGATRVSVRSSLAYQ
ncbi:MAG: FtsX-like permease family protein [Chloroflexota bacterium]